MDSSNLTKAKQIILASNHFYSVRDFQGNTLMMLYSKPDEKASCGTACCLGCFMFPVGIIYAILGGKRGVNKQIILEENNGKIFIIGDAKYVLKVYKILKNSELGNLVPESKNIKKIKKTMLLVKIVWITFFIILFIILINSSSNNV
ncbi:hypothetical protein H3C61_00975 [Candidatus Gracilibacteria bacterium]|nr:hypothetical protein [Candidatus Gracilibacteria bacterium]